MINRIVRLIVTGAIFIAFAYWVAFAQASTVGAVPLITGYGFRWNITASVLGPVISAVNFPTGSFQSYDSGNCFLNPVPVPIGNARSVQVNLGVNAVVPPGYNGVNVHCNTFNAGFVEDRVITIFSWAANNTLSVVFDEFYRIEDGLAVPYNIGSLVGWTINPLAAYALPGGPPLCTVILGGLGAQCLNVNTTLLNPLRTDLRFTGAPAATATPTNTPVNTSTNTSTPSITPTPSLTPTPSNTPTSSNTPSVTPFPSATTVPTASNTPINTLTPSSTPSPTSTSCFPPGVGGCPTRIHTPEPTRFPTATSVTIVTLPPIPTLAPIVPSPIPGTFAPPVVTPIVFPIVPTLSPPGSLLPTIQPPIIVVPRATSCPIDIPPLSLPNGDDLPGITICLAPYELIPNDSPIWALGDDLGSDIGGLPSFNMWEAISVILGAVVALWFMLLLRNR